MTIAVWNSAVTTYSTYLRLNLSTTPDVKFLEAIAQFYTWYDNM